MNRHALGGLVVGLVAWTALGHAAPVPGATDGPGAIRVADQRLEGKISGAHLDHVLATIAAQSGIAIRVHGESGTSVSGEFRGVPIEEGLRSLLRDVHFLLVYAGPPAPGGPGPTLSEVHVYPPTGHGASSPPGALSAPGTGGETSLAGESSAVRSQATRGRAGRADAAVDELSIALASEEDAAARESVARRLGRARSPESVPALARAVADDPDDGVREVAARALGKVWSDAVVEPLVQALGDAHAAVRAAAAEALGETWSETAAEALSLAVGRDPSAQVRERALTALSRLGDDEVRGPLAIASQDPSPRVRRVALEILEALATAPPE